MNTYEKTHAWSGGFEKFSFLPTTTLFTLWGTAHINLHWLPTVFAGSWVSLGFPILLTVVAALQSISALIKARTAPSLWFTFQYYGEFFVSLASAVLIACGIFLSPPTL